MRVCARERHSILAASPVYLQAEDQADLCRLEGQVAGGIEVSRPGPET